MPNLSASSYLKFRTCPRLYYWEEILRLHRVRQDGARAFGSMYHAGLEAWWRSADGGFVPWRDRDESLVLALKAIGDSARHVDTDPFEQALAEVMMVAYHARYYELDFETPHSGSGVEEWFSVELQDQYGRVVPNWRLTGKRDAMKKFADGRNKVVEHKSTRSEINGASDYWARLRLDHQVTIYIDAANRLGLPTSEALYDASRKPELRPRLATPEDRQKMTKGKGCRYCGGRAGGKQGVAAGTGRIMVRTKVDGDGNVLPAPQDVEVECTHCNGTGWSDAPRLNATQRTEDESPLDFKDRVAGVIAKDPNAYFRMGTVQRSEDDIAEARADLLMTTTEIDAFVSLGRKSGDMRSVEARRCFPRNSKDCTNMYGRRCDFLDVCSGAVNPFESPHYAVRTRESKETR